jgi:glucose/arabinose dehydrogenase
MSRFTRPFAFVVFLASACTSAAPSTAIGERDADPEDAAEPNVVDAGRPVVPRDGGGFLTERFCDLPGSVQFTTSGIVVVPGPNTAMLDFLQLPAGFCVHFYGNVGNTRQIRFAPGGEVFVASPTTSTTGGGSGGRAEIVVLPDDDGDGVADEVKTFLKDLPSTQGLLFANDHFYYQDHTAILRIPYAPGDRAPSLPSEQVVDIQVHVSGGHWPKALDQADDGTIYVGNGGDQGEECDLSGPFRGGVLKIDGKVAKEVARGFRNPIAVRCQRGHNVCFAAELARDFSADQGGREKVVPIRQGDDWGFPCCATKGVRFPDVTMAADCSKVVSENVSFVIGDTPFGFDFEPGKWPAPYTGAMFVALHGAAGSWKGAGLVSIAVDPLTGALREGTNLYGGPSGSMAPFASGWDNNKRMHGRPAAVTFAADGRLFLGDDNSGDIVWIAPLDLPTH